MAEIIRIKVSDTPKIPDSRLKDFKVLGLDPVTNDNAHAEMEQLRGNTAFQEWQSKNPGKTYEDYLAMLRQPATDAATEVRSDMNTIKQEWQTEKTDINGIKTDWNNTLKPAINSATSSANTAATNANNKATLANTAATNANTAANAANAAKEGVEEAIEKAEEVAEHPPIIGADLYWYYWDADAQTYVKTDKYSKGAPGAGNVDIVNTSSVVKDVPYILSPTANGAQTYNAVEAVVGGRNYLPKSKLVVTQYYSDNTWFVPESATGFVNAYLNVTIQDAGLYTLSALIKKGNINPRGVRIAVNNTTVRYLSELADAANYKLFSHTFELKEGDSLNIQLYNYDNSVANNPKGDLYVKNIVLTKGTIPSDWSPAPEDKQDVIDIPNWRLPYKANGVWEGRILDVAPNSNTVPTRTDGGRVKVSDAVEANDAVNLGQLMAQFRGNYEIVTTLPAVGVEGKMYLVTTSTANVYNLKTWKQVSGVYKYVDLGSTAIDLSNYAKIADLNYKNDLLSKWGDTVNVDLDTIVKESYILVKSHIDKSKATNLFPAVNNANAVISISKHPNGAGNVQYVQQLGFNGGGYMYTRSKNGTTWTPWVRLVNESDLLPLAKKSVPKSTTLTAANWVDDTANSGFWKYTVNDAEIAATSTVVHVPASTADKAKGKDAGLDEYAEATAGKLVIFSESKPGENININYVIQD